MGRLLPVFRGLAAVQVGRRYHHPTSRRHRRVRDRVRGSRSLRVYFQVRSHVDTINVSQLVPVNANTEYDFECYLKTEKLESAETPVILIVNAGDDKALTGSTPAPSGNSDWQRIFLSFKTGEKTEAVKVKMVRNSCADSPVCPIFGTVWYDDFDLKPRK